MSAHDFDSDALRIAVLDEDRRQQLLSAYLDGELSPGSALEVSAWLDEHPDALREVEHLRRLWDLLEVYEDEPVPDDFAARVLAQTRRPPRRRLAGLALAAAAALLLGVGIGLLAGPGDSGSRPTELARAPLEESEAPAAVLEEVPPDLLENVDLLLALSDDEFEGLLIADLDAP